MTWSPRDKRLITASADGDVRVWSPAASTLPGAQVGQGVYELERLGPDVLLAAGADGDVVLLSLGRGELQVLKGLSAPVIEVAGSGAWVAGIDRAGRLAVWGGDALDSGGKPWLLPEKTRLADLTASADGRYLAAAGADGVVRLLSLDPQTGRVLRLSTLAGHEGAAAALSFSESTGELVTVGADGSLRVWPLVAPALDLVLEPVTGSSVEALGFALDGTQALVRLAGGEVLAWTLEGTPTEPATGELDLSSGPADSEASVDLACAAQDGGDLVVSAQNSMWQPFRLLGHVDDVSLVALHPGGEAILSASEDGTVRLWHLLDPEELQALASSFGDRCISAEDRASFLLEHPNTAADTEWRCREGPQAAP